MKTGTHLSHPQSSKLFQHPQSRVLFVDRPRKRSSNSSQDPFAKSLVRTIVVRMWTQNGGCMKGYKNYGCERMLTEFLRKPKTSPCLFRIRKFRNHLNARHFTSSLVVILPSHTTISPCAHWLSRENKQSSYLLVTPLFIF